MKNKAQRIIDDYDGDDLYLSGCDLKGITLPTTIGGYLDLSGCDLKGITLPTTIGGSLDLRGCDLKGITLPTTIGGSLYLSGCENVPNGVYNCGDENRTIAVYNHPEQGLVVTLGCFIGMETECHEAIQSKYGTGQRAEKYKSKITEAFKLYYAANY